jgi:hypothetical protein
MGFDDVLAGQTGVLANSLVRQYCQSSVLFKSLETEKSLDFLR